MQIGSSLPPQRQVPDRQLERAAEDLEAHFLGRMLEQVHAGSATLGSGVGGSMYQSMLDEKLAQSMAPASPLGIKDMLLRELSTAHTEDIEQKGLGSLSGFTRISSGYGLRQHPVTGEQSFHHGWDLPAAIGTPVTAARAGRVSFSGNLAGYGDVVEIAHEDGTQSRYAHLSKRTVSVGEVVGPSTKIGEVGNSGTSTGPHLHFEVRHSNRSLDPGLWLTTRPLPSTPGTEAPPATRSER